MQFTEDQWRWIMSGYVFVACWIPVWLILQPRDFVNVQILYAGLILAFVGATELARFGASIYTADLVAVAVVREMACIMTGIILCGRTGAAFAAHGLVQEPFQADGIARPGPEGAPVLAQHGAETDVLQFDVVIAQ